MGRGRDRHGAHDRQRAGRVGSTGGGQQAAAEFGGACKGGHRLAWVQPDPVEPGSGLVQPWAAESPE
jgi:hypothetical protein